MRKNIKYDICLRLRYILKIVIIFIEFDGLVFLFWNFLSFFLNDKCFGFLLGFFVMRIFFFEKENKGIVGN